MRSVLKSILIVLLFFASCKTENKQEIKTESIAFTKEGQLTITQSESGKVLAQLDIEIADTEYETQTGLMYRESMEDSQGMLFVFKEAAEHSFYMKNTQFSLDIIYIDENLKIASFQKNTTPFDESSLPSGVPVQYVLEVKGGLSDVWGLKVGDSIAFNKI
ncbi:DUF192 domain-containing protein [Flagellimonas meridianipacifica]|uniref:DUF192 domain-containing protein n=1 Tax=Flagellimonas meridianipacifica TaxID=1080225 RepID=A0A2T0M8N2_9FLAO|nr:DUF192 domain-containing protein [Allomuricauda pacifica]PRX53897.1 hypothetical protein CLV81_2288 [Allomuricauda pacifica]